jgi:hypothetical protein
MSLIRRAIPATAAIIVVALLLAACGGASTTTSTSGNPTGAASSGGPPKNFLPDAYKYSACMRNHGVADFPDPVVSHSGNGTSISIRVPEAAGASPQFKSAQQACRSILPAPSKADLAAQAQQQRIHAQDLLAFARCLRNHGINGFPDPNAQGQLTLQMVQAAGIDLTAPQVRTEALACVSAANGALSRADIIQATSGNPQQSGSSSGSATSSNP